MGKYISGEVKCTICFDSVYVEDGESEINAIFPDGYEGEMNYNFTELEEDNEEYYDECDEYEN